MRELIIVDAGLDDIDALLGRRTADAHVTTVSASEDAHAVLAAALAERPDAVHLVAHGEPGRVLLGSRPLDALSLLDRSWPDAHGTEIHIHACRAGAGEAGRLLIERLAAATGAQVAAATRPLGHADLGGVWELDVATGPIRTPSLFAGHEAWPHLLAVTGTATAGNDTLTGDDIGNVFDGGAGNDSLVGGTGNDTFMGGAGADTMIGGEGFDIVSYEAATGSMVLDLLEPANNTGDAAGDVFDGIERWIGGEFNDTMIAHDSGVWFWGHGGDDLERGGAGDDTLESGDGNDTVYGGAGNDHLYGRADDDSVYGEDGDDTLVGGSGADLLDGGAGNDNLVGDWGVDTMRGGDGDDTFMAGEVSGGGYDEPQADIIEGGAGNDVYMISNSLEAGTVSFNGGAGTDTLLISSDNLTDAEGKVSTATPVIDISGMTLTSVEVLSLTGGPNHTVTMTAAQAAGFSSITGVRVGDVFNIAGTAMSGTVTAGNGAGLGAGQVQAETVDGTTLLHIGVDGNAGADVTLRLAGSLSASAFELNGSGFTIGNGTVTPPPDDNPPPQDNNPPPQDNNPPPQDNNPPPQDNNPPPATPTMQLQRIVDGVPETALAQAYQGPVSYLQWQYLGDGRGEVVGGSGDNDFLNLMGGNDAAAGGAGDDVLDGGSGSNWLIGGTGNDTFFVDGRNPEPTWSTITDLERGEWTTLWGYQEGVSRLTWEEMGGAEGYKGATAHCDIDGNGTIDASVTFAGSAVSEMLTSASSINGSSYIAFIKL